MHFQNIQNNWSWNRSNSGASNSNQVGWGQLGPIPWYFPECVPNSKELEIEAEPELKTRHSILAPITRSKTAHAEDEYEPFVSFASLLVILGPRLVVEQSIPLSLLSYSFFQDTSLFSLRASVTVFSLLIEKIPGNGPSLSKSAANSFIASGELT